MQKLKKIIIILGIVLIFVIVTAILIVINIKNKRVIEDGVAPVTFEQEKTLKLVENKLEYFSVEDCIKKYYLYYVRTFNAEDYYIKTFGSKNYNLEEIEKYEQKSANVLYNMLDEEVVELQKITSENIKSKLNEIEISSVNIINMYVSRKNEDITVYFINGLLKNENTNKFNKFQVIMKLDEINGTFNIIPQQYIDEKYNNIEIGNEIDINTPEEIKENENNKFKYRAVNDKKYVEYLMEQLKNEIEYFPELVYNKLNQEYRDKKFASLEEFTTYINNNEKFKEIQLDAYKVNIENQHKQYICTDKNNNYYIFDEKSAMQCELMFDTYTIDLSEFIEKYDSSENNIKMALNIEKLIDATEDQDYKYVYNKLDDTFKTNNFPTLQDFENFIKGKFNDKEDEITYEEYENVAGVHVYKIVVKDKSENKIINAKVIMDLKDNRDFVFSFSVEN